MRKITWTRKPANGTVPPLTGFTIPGGRPSGPAGRTSRSLHRGGDKRDVLVQPEGVGQDAGAGAVVAVIGFPHGRRPTDGRAFGGAVRRNPGAQRPRRSARPKNRCRCLRAGARSHRSNPPTGCGTPGARCCAPKTHPEEEVDFVLDRPFLFAITGVDNLPLFVGLVNRPVCRADNRCRSKRYRLPPDTEVA